MVAEVLLLRKECGHERGQNRTFREHWMPESTHQSRSYGGSRVRGFALNSGGSPRRKVFHDSIEKVQHPREREAPKCALTYRVFMFFTSGGIRVAHASNCYLGDMRKYLLSRTEDIPGLSSKGDLALTSPHFPLAFQVEACLNIIWSRLVSCCAIAPFSGSSQASSADAAVAAGQVMQFIMPAKYKSIRYSSSVCVLFIS